MENTSLDNKNECWMLILIKIKWIMAWKYNFITRATNQKLVLNDFLTEPIPLKDKKKCNNWCTNATEWYLHYHSS